MRYLQLAVLTVVLSLGALAIRDARADEGMWTFHDFPSAKVKAKYGFSPDQPWLDKARMSSARLAGICSASFVSDNGLVMTNHHCAHDCVAGLSSKEHDYVHDGFWAPKLEDEKKCPDLEVQQLDQINDVTAQVLKATTGKTGAAYTAALREVSASIEKPCQTAPTIRCELVDLYHGGQFMLYRYKRYTDVRVVGVPELAIAFFGGDPDNFEFPRYDLDMSFVRAYENGKPAATPDHFAWSPAGPKDNELTFVSGDPGSTEREITTAERVFDRDAVAPLITQLRSEWRGELTEYMRGGDEQKRTATEWQFYNENSLKVWKGRQAALGDDAMMKKRADDEAALQAQIKAKPDLAKDVGDSFDAIAKAHARFKPLFRRYYILERWSKGDLLNDALRLVRAADERSLPDGKRLDEYRDSALPDIEQKVSSTAPIYPAREKLAIAFWLGKLREELGADDPTVKAMLGKNSPTEVASQLVDLTKLMDPAERTRLYKGGKAAVGTSHDPMINMVRLFDAAARRVRKINDDDVDGITKSAHEKIAKARFALEGRSSYPDATFTLRLSYGAVKGYVSTAHGTKVAPFTFMGGAFDRATGQPPFDLPKTWLDAKNAINPRVPFDVATTNDIIGGNSGSPMFNQKLEIVGLIFDGNIESLAGDFWYDEASNRAVAVTSEAIIHALSKIYHADRLVEELRPTKGHK
ncbi:MAG TPA: S46 family peptidase [Kofleriaceae bacterium]